MSKRMFVEKGEEVRAAPIGQAGRGEGTPCFQRTTILRSSACHPCSPSHRYVYLSTRPDAENTLPCPFIFPIEPRLPFGTSSSQILRVVALHHAVLFWDSGCENSLGVFLFCCRISYGWTPGKPFRCVPSGGAGFTRPRRQKRFGDPRPSRSSRTSKKGLVLRRSRREINRVHITLRLPMRLSAICPTCPVSTLEIKGKAGLTSLSQLGLMYLRPPRPILPQVSNSVPERS
jgi:hypothetical protein